MCLWCSVWETRCLQTSKVAFTKGPYHSEPDISGILKPCLGAPGHPGMRNIWDFCFLERPGSPSGSTSKWGVTIAILVSNRTVGGGAPSTHEAI